MSEHLLIDQCAPTLAGLKTGSLFLCADPPEDLHRALRELNRRYADKGLRMLPMRQSGGKTLIYVYRPRLLAADLLEGQAAGILKKLDYAPEKPDLCVARLRRRLAMGGDFPHEIGLFLGYPAEDVAGFIAHGARDAKCTGFWKVYGNPVQAEETFRRFRKCTKNYRAAYEKHSSIDKLVVSC